MPAPGSDDDPVRDEARIDAASSVARPLDAGEASDDRMNRVDAMVDTAAAAGRAFRELDQEQVDPSSRPWCAPGSVQPPSWPRWPSRRPGSASSRTRSSRTTSRPNSSHDYLQDKQSVGVIDEDVERNIVHVAEPIGVVLAITPVTNPTSTVLFKAIVAAKTRNAIALPPVAVRDAVAASGASRSCARPPRRPACRPGRCR